MTGILGYARVSPSDQDVAGQSMRLTEAGAIKVFTDVRSGRTMDRPGLVELLAYARNGDTLAVVRLDRLGRSLAELLSTVSIFSSRLSKAIPRSAWKRRSTRHPPPVNSYSTCLAQSLISSAGLSPSEPRTELLPLTPGASDPGANRSTPIGSAQH
jgi:hypothetical protein